MPELNKAVIGKEYGPIQFEIKKHETVYYALATNDWNPWYVDGSRDGGIVAPPMYAVHYGGSAVGMVFFDKEVGEGFMPFLVHGEQDMEWFKAVRPGDKIQTTVRISDIIDKGSGELLVVETTSRLAEETDVVCRQTSSFFVRGYGRLERKSKAPEPEEDKSELAFQSSEKVLPGQSHAYAEPSGDHNPIHLNEEFARKVGLGGIILQGLCTMAFCHKAAVNGLADGDPAGIKRLSVRFSRPVCPGDEISIRSWWIKKGELAGLEAFTHAGSEVIKNGRAHLGKIRS